MVRVNPKHSLVPTEKRKKEGPIKTVPREMWSRLTKWKAPKPHKEGHCKICHKDVKNLEAHMKTKHRGTKV